jgi:ELWxxDGT repeat protein
MKRINNLFVFLLLKRVVLFQCLILSLGSVSAQYHEVKLIKDFDYIDDYTNGLFWYANHRVPSTPGWYTYTKGSVPTQFSLLKDRLYLATRDSLYYVSSNNNGQFETKSFTIRLNAPDQSTSLVVGNNLFYRNRTGLYVSDGNSEGTLLKFFGRSANEYISHLFEFKGKCYFFVMEEVGKFSLWESDGTASGTKVVIDLPWNNLYEGTPKILYRANKFYFKLEGNVTLEVKGVWESDGTEGGTKLLVKGPGQYRITDSPIFHNDKLYFIGDDDIKGKELWVVDNLATGANRLVKDNVEGTKSTFYIGGLYSIAGKLFLKQDGYYEKPDGNFSTPEVSVYEPSQNQDPNQDKIISLASGTLQTIIAFKNKIFFVSDGKYYETDGTKSGTKPFGDGSFTWSGKAGGLFQIEYKDRLYFTGEHPSNPNVKLWSTDGTDLKPVTDAKDMTFYEGLVYKNKLFLSALEPAMGLELYSVEEKTADHVIPTVNIDAVEGHTDPIVYVDAPKSSGIVVTERFFKITDNAGKPLENVILAYSFKTPENVTGYYPSSPSNSKGILRIVLPSYIFNGGNNYFTTMDVTFVKVITVNDVVYENVKVNNNGFKPFQIRFNEDPLSRGLVAHYPFNANPNFPTIGNANDESGRGNSGIVSGALPTKDRFGNAYKALNFNGTSDYVSFTGFPTNPINNDMSISLWMRPTDLNQLGMAITYGFDNGQRGEGIAIGVGNGTTGTSSDVVKGGNKLHFAHGGISFYPGNYTFLNTQDWVHVVVVRNSTTSIIYANGVNVINHTERIIEPKEFRIGSANGIRFFKGDIDDIRIYNRAISQIEIEKLYGKPIDDINRGLIAHYPFNGDAKDIGPNGLLGSGIVPYEDFGNGSLGAKFNGNGAPILL